LNNKRYHELYGEVSFFQTEFVPFDIVKFTWLKVNRVKRGGEAC